MAENLYLTSYRIPNIEKFASLFTEPLENLQGGIVVNAKDKTNEQSRAEKLVKLQTDLGGHGLNNTCFIDLRKPYQLIDNTTGKPRYDYVFVAGGNTFNLMDAMQENNFAAKVREYLGAGGIYAGESAGAVVAGPSIRGFDAPNVERQPRLSYDGLRLTDVICIPHSDSADPYYAGRIPHIAAQNPGYIHHCLNDTGYLIKESRHIKNFDSE